MQVIVLVRFMDEHLYSGLLSDAQQSAIDYLTKSQQINNLINNLYSQNNYLRPRNLFLAERRDVLAALTKTFIKLGWKVGIEKDDRVREEWHEEWANFIYIDTPDGRVVFHIHDSELNHFDHLLD